MSTQLKKLFAPTLYTGAAHTRTHEGTDVKPQKWFISYYAPDDDGKRKRVKLYDNLNTITDKQARYARAHMLMDEISRMGGHNRSGSVLLNELAELKLVYKNKTYAEMRAAVERLHTYLQCDRDKFITKETATNFLLWLKKKGLSDTTVHNYKLRLSAIYSRVAARERNYNNPFKDIDIIKPSSKSMMFFTADQVEKIKGYCYENDKQLWLAIQLLFYCFIRPGELRLLKVGDIYLDSGFIELRGEISKNGKTEKVVIPEQLKDALTRLGGDVNAYVFSYNNMPGKLPLPKNHLYRRCVEALKAVNIRGRYSLYSFKHTGAVMAVRAGINVKDLQLQLRHHSLDMVNEYLKDMGVMDSDDLKNKFPGI